MSALVSVVRGDRLFTAALRQRLARRGHESLTVNWVRSIETRPLGPGPPRLLGAGSPSLMVLYSGQLKV